jgi:hypothetical protein
MESRTPNSKNKNKKTSYYNSMTSDARACGRLWQDVR